MSQRSQGSQHSRLLFARMNRRTLAGGAALGAAGLASMRVPLVGAQTEVTWTSWGNTGEVANLQAFTESYNASQADVRAVYNPQPTDGYGEALLTQLNGGTAPDIFYVSDELVATLVQNEVLMDLTDLLSSDASLSRPEDFAGDLWGPALVNERYYGVPVDCNPLVLWYNKGLLEEAGITEMPADSYEAGNWTWDTFQTILDAIAETGRTPFVLNSWWALRYSWPTSNGGAIYADGRFVAHEDEASMEAFQFLADNIAAEKITFSGSLPQGQGDDAMFLSGQLGFVSVGRWGLPLFRENPSLDCDVVPYPTNTGNPIEPAGVAVAYWCMNATPTADVDAAFAFYTHFVSAAGQTERLGDGGNAVPSIAGAEDVVTGDDAPEHRQYFLDARDVGYGPLAEEAGTPGLPNTMNDMFEALWLDGGDVQAALDAIAEAANAAIDEFAG